jgi:hypothetical protein
MMPTGTKPVDQMESLTFPSKGLDVNSPFTQQPADTTSVGINCRTYDQFQQRARGGSRSGISKYVSGIVNPGSYIQELNTVAYVNESAIGSVNYYAGDTSLTTMAFPGTYLLGRLNADGGFSVSTPIAVDGSGNVSVGVEPGYPEGTDLQELPTGQQVNLPSTYFVMAYWQPGVFPLTQGDWQTGDVFPGTGYFQLQFPGSMVDYNFGFPDPPPGGVLETTIPDPLPELPFWYWPSGYETIEISILLGIARCTVLGMYIGPGELIIPTAGSLSMIVNVNGVNAQPITLLAPNSTTSGGVFVVTDEVTAFTGGLSLGTLQVDPTRTVFDGTMTTFFTAGGQFTPIVVPIPNGAFSGAAPNVLQFNGEIVSTDLSFGLSVLGVFRFRKFILPGWNLAVAIQGYTATNVYGVSGPAFGYYPYTYFQTGNGSGQPSLYAFTAGMTFAAL